eukprot:CCRYP_007450-RA/>CCRYP_007450-RA protein AED:0.29 eAED:0.29 QI:0/0/0/1/1/1/3/0/633
MAISCSNAWYVGPAKKHYRCYKFYIAETKGYRIANTAKFYPAHCKTPTIEPGDTIRLAAQDLIAAMKQTDKNAPISLHHKHTEALQKLASIFAEAAGETEHSLPRVPQPVPRVQRAVPRVPHRPTTSTEPTAPSKIKRTRFVHQRVTRSNVPPPPMPTIHEESLQSLARAKRRERRTQAVEPPPVRKKKPVREYQQAQQRVKDVTPTPVPQPPPAYISQEEDEANHTRHNTQTTPPQASPNPCGIPARAVYALMEQHVAHTSKLFIPDKFASQTATYEDSILLEHMANGVVHPITQETITKYEKLANVPIMKDTWMKAMCKELGRLAQGTEPSRTPGLLLIIGRKKRIRIELESHTLSTPGAKFGAADVGNFYLATPLDRFEYMRIKAELVPEDFKRQYKLHDKIYKGFIYMEIRRGCYGLPQSGILANKLLKKRLAKHGYFEVAHTPGLWKHVSRPVQFTLVVDNFGIKYVGEDNFNHLINALQQHYDVTINKEGKLYCGITLNWDYNKRTLDISMLGYVQKQLIKYNHPMPKSPQHCPWSPHPIQYGSKTREPLPPDESPKLDKKGIKFIQQVVGSFLYYCRATDTTIPAALSELSQQQTNATENTLKRCEQFLDYMATHPDATIRYYAPT